MRLVTLYILLLLDSALVLYFSWVPDPRLSILSYLPDWLGSWVDKH